MKGMKSCPKCKGGMCKGGKGCMKEEKASGGKSGGNLPMRGMRTKTNKSKK